MSLDDRKWFEVFTNRHRLDRHIWRNLNIDFLQVLESAVEPPQFLLQAHLLRGRGEFVTALGMYA